MKALNVLNESKRAICIFIDSFDEESKEDDEYTSSIKYLEEINEAIKELEELENRSCGNCKHNKEQDNFMIFCDAVVCQDGSKMMWHSFTKDFCCNKWEKE